MKIFALYRKIYYRNYQLDIVSIALIYLQIFNRDLFILLDHWLKLKFRLYFRATIFKVPFSD